MVNREEKITYQSGMVRDSAKTKTRWDLIFDGPIAGRYAAHLTTGAGYYGPRNWMQAAGEEEMERFRQSAARHFAQWMAGEVDEDHAAAIVFNLNGYEYVKEKLPMERVVETAGQAVKRQLELEFPPNREDIPL